MPIIKECQICGLSYKIKPCHASTNVACSWRCGRAVVSRRLLAARCTPEQPADHRLIATSNGSIVRVSIEDYEYSSGVLWQTNSGSYAQNSHGLMHVQIAARMGIVKGQSDIDHINRDRLDNRRENLRLATRSQNIINKTKTKTTRSLYKGVNPAPSGRWQADLWDGGTCITVGTFDDEYEAAWMRDQWALEVHGEFAVLNLEYVES